MKIGNGSKVILAKACRFLGYVSFERIIDQRNALPIIHRRELIVPESSLTVGLEVDIPDIEDFDPQAVASGFVVRQAYHLVIFGEKSSLEDIIDPIAEEIEADLYLPTGEISDTLVYQMAKDAAEDGRPLIVFTLSDCDPAGWQMPVSIGRKLQAFKALFFPELQFEVVPIGLTPDQVREYGLPSTPLKATERRASKWKKAFGIEQTEIDAMMIPERIPILERLVRDAVAPYLDPTLDRRVRAAKAVWQAQADAALAEQVDPETLARIREAAAERLEELREEIERLNERLAIATPDVDLPAIEVPEPEGELDLARHALTKLDDDFVAATRALKARKTY